MKLTARQRRFVDEYLVDLNATQAAIRAGYSAKNADVDGPRLLGNAGIAAAIAAAQAARSARTEISQDWVLATLKENVERAMQAVEIRDQDGGTGEYKYDGSVANRALELIGKHLGMFVERRELTGRGGGPIEHAVSAKELDDDTLARIALAGGG